MRFVRISLVCNYDHATNKFIKDEIFLKYCVFYNRSIVLSKCKNVSAHK